MRYLLKHKRYGTKGDVDDWFEFAHGQWHDCTELEQRIKDALDAFAARPFLVCHREPLGGVMQLLHTKYRFMNIAIGEKRASIEVPACKSCGERCRWVVVAFPAVGFLCECGERMSVAANLQSIAWDGSDGSC